MTTPDTAPAKPETTRHRIHEVPGQTKPVGKPDAAPKKTVAKKPKAAAKPTPQAKPSRAKASAAEGRKRLDKAMTALLPKRETKGDIVIRMLRRPEGATSAQLEKATGWQAHSIRGFFAGTLKKKKGLEVTSAKADGVRTYHLAEPQADAPEAV